MLDNIDIDYLRHCRADHGPISLPLLFTEAPVHLLDGGSPPKKNNVKLEDDEEPKEWNTISGVSVEQEPQDETSPAKEEPQLVPGERTSLMKTITNLWTGNPANFLPLEYPT